jgi:serine protease DegQ
MTTDEEAPQAAASTSRRARLRIAARRTLPFAATILLTLLMLFVYEQVRTKPVPLTTGDVDAMVNTTLAEATPAPARSADVYQVILPSLVFISTQGAPPREGGGRILDAPADQTTSPNLAPIAGRAQGGDDIAYGSGVVISGDGAILTALHVVEYADEIFVTFADGTQAKAAIAAVMPDNDIAVLMPDKLPETFAPAVLGNPGALRIGDEAFVVGNPLGLAGSISAGVISGFDRTYKLANHDEHLQRLIQFDAAVNVGSSGGPLLNRNGEVVGIVVGLVNPTAQQSFSGIGFAVRIDQAAAAAGAPEL